MMELNCFETSTELFMVYFFLADLRIKFGFEIDLNQNLELSFKLKTNLKKSF